MTSTRPPADGNHWGSTLVTAADLVRFYSYLMDAAPGATRQVVLRALDGAPAAAPMASTSSSASRARSPPPTGP